MNSISEILEKYVYGVNHDCRELTKGGILIVIVIIVVVVVI